MWPWDHLAFGYLLFVLVQWLRGSSRVDDRTMWVLAIGTQLPDLIDKPLAWSMNWLPSGVSLGHSLSFAVVVSLVAYGLESRHGRERHALAVSVGIVSHLIGDVLFAFLTRAEFVYEFLFWPFVPAVPDHRQGLLTSTVELWTQFLVFLGTNQGRFFLAGETVTILVAATIWLWDGAPGTHAIRRRISERSAWD